MWKKYFIRSNIIFINYPLLVLLSIKRLVWSYLWKPKNTRATKFPISLKNAVLEKDKRVIAKHIWATKSTTLSQGKTNISSKCIKKKAFPLKFFPELARVAFSNTFSFLINSHSYFYFLEMMKTMVPTLDYRRTFQGARNQGQGSSRKKRENHKAYEGTELKQRKTPYSLKLKEIIKGVTSYLTTYPPYPSYLA